uniref:CRAL-TRIO domain-containing protein n=1 Tax=Ditylenchus dipsaci TaxID=166011 RepID=A0A915CN38_9BILA
MPPPENSVARGARAEDIIHVLRDRVALLPGARDRDNRPIVFVPAKENSAQINPDHLRNLLLYLYEVTSDDVKENGFVFVIDMRKGTTWNVVKPVLKCLQEFFPGTVTAVLIIKPDNFWEKHKTSVSTGKYKFDIQMISIDNLTKYMDAGQIVREFGGSLFYDHEDWLDLRVDIEKLVWRSSEILRHFEKYSTLMSSSDIPVDVVKAEEAISKHQKLQSLIASLSVEGVEADVEQLKKRIFNECEYLPVSSNGSILHSTSNPDLSSIFPHLVQLTKTLARTRAEISCQWELKKQDLDQCYQMKLFEKDAESAYQWIRARCNQLSHSFTITGNSESDTDRLLTEHKDLTNGVDKYEISYNHVMDVGRRLHKLQLEQRNRLLKLTFNVHQKCNLFLKNYGNWIENVGVDPSLVMDKSHDELNAFLEEHDSFEQVFENVYSEAYADATQLSKMMKKIYGENVGSAQSYKQLLELIQRITHAKRNLHSIWKSRRESIHYRMSSAIFSSDMRSVIDWLEQHGEPFLRRKIAIGQDRVSATSLSVNHENFRNVAMNTYRNANQLFTMAAELKNAGEVNEEETTQALLELRRKIDSFRKKVDMRTNLLFIASNFFLHYDEIMAWYCKMDDRLASLSVVPESVEECERNKEKLQSENDGTLQAFARVIAEANQLHAALQQQRVVLNVDNSEAIRHVENLARNIENRQAAEKDRWSSQRIYLNAACKVAVFLRDCSEIRRQLMSWSEDLKGLKHSVSNKADVVMHYHRQNTESVRSV